MERLGRWQLLGPHRASRASTHFTPLPPPLCLSLCLFSLVPQNCYAKLSRQRWGTSFELRRIQNLLSWRCWSDIRAVTSPETCTPPFETCSPRSETTFVQGKSDPVVDLYKLPWEMMTPQSWLPDYLFCYYGNKTLNTFKCQLLMVRLA